MKILIIEMSNLGDAILTLSAIHRLLRATPEAEVHVLASQRVHPLFFRDRRFHRVWIWEREDSFFKQFSLIRELMALRFNLVVDFRHSMIPLFFPGARRTPILRRPYQQTHRVEQHLRLLDPLGIPPFDGPAPLWSSPEDEKEVSRWLVDGCPKVAMAPGARSHLKRWEAKHFALLGDRLVHELQAQVLLVGEEEERPIADEVRSHMRLRLTDLVGLTTLQQLAILLKKVDLLVTNDNACLHVAEAMGTPTVALFGPTDERKYGPRNPHSIVVRKHLVCAPCELALCPYNHECMRWLGVDEVLEAAARILKNVSEAYGRADASVKA